SKPTAPVWKTSCVTGTMRRPVGKIGVGVDVGPGVLVGVAVGQTPGHGVLVGGGVSVGVAEAVGVAVNVGGGVGHDSEQPTTSRMPPRVAAGMRVPFTSVMIVFSSETAVVPTSAAMNVTEAILPVPVAPGGGDGPSVTQVYWTLAGLICGARQKTVRPVVPRKGPVVTAYGVRTVGSNERVNWNAARSVTCCTSMSTSKVEPMICVWKKGWTQTAAPAVPQSIAGVGVNVGVMVGVGESVAVGHGPPGHAVEVGVGCGATVTAPSYATEKMLSPSGFASDGSRSSTVVPAETGVQVMCASVPAPLGPGCAPLVTQPKWSR